MAAWPGMVVVHFLAKTHQRLIVRLHTQLAGWPSTLLLPGLLPVVKFRLPTPLVLHTHSRSWSRHLEQSRWTQQRLRMRFARFLTSVRQPSLMSLGFVVRFTNAPRPM